MKIILDFSFIFQGKSNVLVFDSLARFYDQISPEELKLPNSTLSLEDDLKVRQKRIEVISMQKCTYLFFVIDRSICSKYWCFWYQHKSIKYNFIIESRLVCIIRKSMACSWFQLCDIQQNCSYIIEVEARINLLR